jgi:hypothetical protein
MEPLLLVATAFTTFVAIIVTTRRGALRATQEAQAAQAAGAPSSPLGPTRPLAHLPPELLDQVLSNLPPSSLCSAARVNRAWAELVAAFLRRRLEVAPNEDGRAWTARGLRETMGEEGEKPSKHWSAAGIDILDVCAHSSLACGAVHKTFGPANTEDEDEDSSPPVLPLPRDWSSLRPRTLRLNVSGATPDPRFHTDRVSARHDVEGGACGLLAGCAPRVLVVRGLGASLRGVRGVLDSADLSHVEEVVYVLDGAFVGSRGNEYNCFFLDRLGASKVLKRITVVLLSSPGREWETLTGARFRADENATARFVDRLLRTIALSFVSVLDSTKAVATLRIVNPEAVPADLFPGLRPRPLGSESGPAASASASTLTSTLPPAAASASASAATAAAPTPTTASPLAPVPSTAPPIDAAAAERARSIRAGLARFSRFRRRKIRIPLPPAPDGEGGDTLPGTFPPPPSALQTVLSAMFSTVAPPVVYARVAPHSALEFVPMKEFVRRGDWVGVLTRDEACAWSGRE